MDHFVTLSYYKHKLPNQRHPNHQTTNPQKFTKIDESIPQKQAKKELLTAQKKLNQKHTYLLGM